jgi:hypothetical protein
MSPDVLAQKTQCVQFFQKKAFVDAANCFEKLANDVGDSASLPQAKKYEKGQYLRNTAVALNRAASAETRPEIAAFLRERAVQILRQYQKDRLFETENRSQTALAQETAIQRQIGYTPLRVVTNHPKANILLEGYEMRQKGIGMWNQSVRPGPYTITVTYPQTEPIVRKVNVIAKKLLIETFQMPAAGVQNTSPGKDMSTRSPTIKTSPTPPAPIPLVSWIGYIGGGLITVTGVILLGVGGSQWIAADRERTTSSNPDYTKLVNQRRDAQPLIWTGIGLLGTGLGLVITGIVSHSTAPHSPKQTSPSPTHSATKSFKSSFLEFIP